MRLHGFSPHFVREFSPRLVTYSALIYGYCSSDRVDQTVEILRGMPEMGLSPDSISYSIVMSGFCRIREMKKAHDMKKELDEKEDHFWLDEATHSSYMQHLSDEVTYASLVGAYLDEGEYLTVVRLYDQMADYISSLDSVTFSVIFNGLDKKTWVIETKVDLMNWIYRTDIPTYPAYGILIENCSNTEFKNLVELVKGLCMRGLENAYDTMLQWNYKPDGAVFNLFILEHCNCGNVHKAYNMYMEMVHYGFAPHMLSGLALIGALISGKMESEVNWVIQNTLRSCGLNDSQLLEALSEIDVTEGEVHALFNVLAEKTMDGLLLNGGKCLIGSGP